MFEKFSIVDSDFSRIYLRLRVKFDLAKLRVWFKSLFETHTHTQAHRQIFIYVLLLFTLLGLLILIFLLFCTLSSKVPDG